jgi:hypothetical protein
MQIIEQTIELPQRYSVPAEQVGARDDLIAESADITAITSAQSQQWASACGSDLQRHIKSVQEARVSLSRPLDEAKAKLIELERNYLAPLLAEKDRLGRLVSAYQIAENERVAAEERQRQAEFERLENERRTLEAKAEKAKSIDQQVQLEQAAYQATEAATAVLMAPLPEVSKAKGAATRMELKWEVTDRDALYKARPDLFTEPELKASAVKACCGVKTVIPGIRFWEIPQTSFRR